MSDYPLAPVPTSVTSPPELAPAQTLTSTTAGPPVAPTTGLAVTGGDIAGLALLGAGALALGVALVRRSARQVHR